MSARSAPKPAASQSAWAWWSIDGLPLGGGFYSKDAILHAAINRYPAIGWIGVFTAGLTAYYMTRLFVTTFLGRMRYDPNAAAATAHAPGHEPAASVARNAPLTRP